VKELAKSFGIEFVLSTLHAPYQAMLVDSQWRVRLNAIEILFGLAVVSTESFFNDNVFLLIVHFLRDPASSVRQFTQSGLPALVNRFGNAWLTTKLLPHLEELGSSPNYLHREVFAFTLWRLAKYFPERRIANYLFRPVMRLLKDDVNSVVIIALRVLADHSAKMHPFLVQCDLRPLLESLVAGGAPTTKELATAFLRRLPA
jgi:hypothetical protein